MFQNKNETQPFHFSWGLEGLRSGSRIGSGLSVNSISDLHGGSVSLAATSCVQTLQALADDLRRKSKIAAGVAGGGRDGRGW